MNNYFLIALSTLFFLITSCADPSPIYFSHPIGKQVSNFDSTMIGNFVDFENFGIKESVKENYEISGSEISLKSISDDSKNLKDSSEIIKNSDYDEDLEENLVTDEYNEVEVAEDDKTGLLKQNNQLELNPIYSSLKLDKLRDIIDSGISWGMYNISPKKITFIGIDDNTGKNYKSVIVELNQSTTLTKYLGNFYLNFKTPYGWEILQIEKWHENYLSFNFIFPNKYNVDSNSEKELLSSVKYLYPNLKTVKNNDNKIVGFKTKTKPKEVIKLFNNKNEILHYELYKWD